MHWDPDVHMRIDAALYAAEARTDAEIVVAVERASGSYRDVDCLAGAVIGAVVVLAMLGAHLGPFELADEWVVAPAVLAYVLALAVSSRTFFLRRLMTTEARRAEQVQQAARVAFVEEGVHATRTRNGVLFYFSDLENGCEIVADHGVKARVDDGTWHVIEQRLRQAAAEDALVPAIEKALSSVTELLATKIPRTSERVKDEVERRLRVRGAAR
ncbi:MAG: hypothetical protein ACAI25_11410 [Planctomycetota bacterium]